MGGLFGKPAKPAYCKGSISGAPSRCRAQLGITNPKCAFDVVAQTCQAGGGTKGKGRKFKTRKQTGGKRKIRRVNRTRRRINRSRRRR